MRMVIPVPMMKIAVKNIPAMMSHANAIESRVRKPMRRHRYPMNDMVDGFILDQAIRVTVIVPFSRSIFVVNDFWLRIAFMLLVAVRIENTDSMGKAALSSISRDLILASAEILWALFFIIC